MFKKTIKKQEKKKETNTEIKNEIKEEKKVSQLTNKDKLEAAKKANIEAREKLKFKFKFKKLYVLFAIGIVILVIAFVLLFNYLDSLKYKPYLKYEEKMKVYGFDKLYDNQTAKTSESVTKAEALKLAIAAVFNTSDITGFAAEHNEYENAIWVEYAKAMKVTTEDININNYNNKVNYIDAIAYFENCKKIFLKNEKIDDLSTKFKDLSRYTVEEQAVIKDMVSNGIIVEVSNKLNGKRNIFKGQLNEIVVNFVENYNTITMFGDKLNINPEKMPANAAEYPYTLANVDKSVYEYPFIKKDSTRNNPKNFYSEKKEYYTHIKERVEDYYNILLNIDYRTISADKLEELMQPYLIFIPSEDVLKFYVDHVKANEIITTGKAEFQEPIMYFDGISYRARLKIEFEIKNSKTNKNIIYLDMLDGYNTIYEKKNYDFFADVATTNAIGNNNIYMREYDLFDAIINKDKSGIIKEKNNSTNDVEEVSNENN